MCLSNQYTDSKDRYVLVVRDPATRALILQAIKEQVEQALNCKINMKVSIWKHKMVGFRIWSDERFIQHVRWKAVAMANSMKQNPTE